jgi:hypothetical protein
MEYDDFELEIDPGVWPTYRVSVLRSKTGEAHETAEFAFDEMPLEPPRAFICPERHWNTCSSVGRRGAR